MLNLPESLNIKTGPTPVGRLLPVLAIDTIGSDIQELGDRATQFSKGQEYIAHVVSKIDDKTHLVRVDNTVLKMDLGNADQAGKSLTLRYVQDGATPTFQLVSIQAEVQSATAEISAGAKLIGQYLKLAQDSGVSPRYEAPAVVTFKPQDPQAIASGLRQSVSHSGLFYESHLNELAQGIRTLAAIAAEPQNQNVMQTPAIISQQLSMLENQRLSWQGEVWPGQKMSWDVYVEDGEVFDRTGQDAEQKAQGEARSVMSEMTLNFPKLGEVTARLSMHRGQVHIGLMANQSSTVQDLKVHSDDLLQAMANIGLVMTGLKISTYE